MKSDKQAAIDILTEMSLDDPKRPFYVNIAGFDPNKKWAEPIGDYETSQALSKLIRK